MEDEGTDYLRGGGRSRVSFISPQTAAASPTKRVALNYQRACARVVFWSCILALPALIIIMCVDARGGARGRRPSPSGATVRRHASCPLPRTAPGARPVPGRDRGTSRPPPIPPGVARAARSILTFTWGADRPGGCGGYVSSEQHLATQAGLKVLQGGGNAFDAAAVVQLVLGVVQVRARGSDAKLRRVTPRRRPLFSRKARGSGAAAFSFSMTPRMAAPTRLTGGRRPTSP